MVSTVMTFAVRRETSIGMIFWSLDEKTPEGLYHANPNMAACTSQGELGTLGMFISRLGLENVEVLLIFVSPPTEANVNMQGQDSLMHQ